MATKQAIIKSNAKEFVKTLDAIAMRRHLAMMSAIADNIDKSRMDAGMKYIVPNRIANLVVKQKMDVKTVVRERPAKLVDSLGRKLPHNAGKTVKYLDIVNNGPTGDLIALVPRKKNTSLHRVARFAAAGLPDYFDYQFAHTVQPSDPTFVTSRTGMLKNALTAAGMWQMNKGRDISKFRPQNVEGRYLDAWVRPQIGNNPYLGRVGIMPRGNKFMEYRTNNEKGRGRIGRNQTVRKKRPFLEPALRGNVGFLNNRLIRINAERIAA